MSQVSSIVAGASFTVVADMLAPFVANPTAAHGIFVDVEPCSNGFALVVRSKDKNVVGATKTPDKAEKRFNDSTGARVALTVATAPDRAVLDTVAVEVLAFYTSQADFAVRWGALSVESQRVMGVLAGVFGAQHQNRNGWKCGSYHAIASAAATAQARDAVEALQKIQRAAANLSNVDALKTALAGAGAVGENVSPDALLASVQALLGAIGVGGAPATAPTSEPTSTPTEPVAVAVGAGATEPTSTTEPTEPTPSTRKNGKRGK